MILKVSYIQFTPITPTPCPPPVSQPLKNELGGYTGLAELKGYTGLGELWGYTGLGGLENYTGLGGLVG